MDSTKIDELERLAAQATPGPWKYRTISKTITTILAGQEPLCATKYIHNKEHDAAYIVAACNAVPSLIARVRGQELINSHLRNQVEGLEELTDDLRANEHELTKQLDFVANCLAQSEKCFMPKEFSCSYRTPYGLYCHAEKAIRLNCIYCRAEEAAKQADMEVENAD